MTNSEKAKIQDYCVSLYIGGRNKFLISSKGSSTEPKINNCSMKQKIEIPNILVPSILVNTSHYSSKPNIINIVQYRISVMNTSPNVSKGLYFADVTVRCAPACVKYLKNVKYLFDSAYITHTVMSNYAFVSVILRCTETVPT
jgi:hypothetical protein